MVGPHNNYCRCEVQMFVSRGNIVKHPVELHCAGRRMSF